MRVAGDDQAAVPPNALTGGAPATLETALEEARRRAERLTILNDASRELTALRTIVEVCDTIYTQTKRVLDCSGFVMGLYAPEREEIDLQLTVDAGQPVPGRSFPLRGSLFGAVIASRTPLVLQTSREMVSEVRIQTHHADLPRSGVYVPMLVGDRVVGVISAQSYREHAYMPEDVQVLQNLASQAAVVIENARLYEQAQGWIRQLEVLQRLGAELNRLDSVSAIAASVARSIESFFPFDAYRVMLVDYEQRELVPLAFGATRPEYDAQSIESLSMPLGEGITGWAALTGEPLLVDHASQHPRALDVPGTPPVEESMLVAPMLRDQRVLGVLSLSKLGLRHYTDDHLRLLRIFADHAATAIANAQLYERERNRSDKLEELDQLRKDFVSTVTHELRTPLTSILGFTETLISFWDRLTAQRQREMVNRIQQSTERLHRLVQDLLVVSRVDAGTLSFGLEPVDIADQVQQALLEITAKYRGQRIDLHGPASSLVVRADAHRVQQVLVNLLDNAAKYSPEGAGITVRWSEQDGMAVLCIEDGGPGIAEAYRPRLFTRFGKIPQVTRAGHVGTGLGLFISRQLVEAMGGAIWVETTVGAGSTFCFSLPLSTG